MKNIVSIIFVSILSLFIFAGCHSQTVQDRISGELGIDVSHGEEISNYDTHSGNYLTTGNRL